MSSAGPSIHPQLKGTALVKDDLCGSYNVPQRMLMGFSDASSAKSKVSVFHPLEYSEKNARESETLRDYSILRQVQGMYAPLHLEIERGIAGKIQRLPCLPSSNLMSDILTGRLDSLDFEDVLNDPSDCERMGMPHMMIERKLSLL